MGVGSDGTGSTTTAGVAGQAGIRGGAGQRIEGIEVVLVLHCVLQIQAVTDDFYTRR
jgi:hypothetical protein